MRTKLFLASALLCFGALAHAQPDTTIRILGVTLPGADTNLASSYLGSIPANWPAGPVGVPVELVNNGTMLPVSSPTGGAGDPQLFAAMTALELLNMRGDADVVLFFTPAISGACGIASAQNWIIPTNPPLQAKFVPDPGTGLDLRESELGYAALVSTSASCFDGQLALHEFGHLFGAGHDTLSEAYNAAVYLFPDSHENYAVIQNGGFKGIMANLPASFTPSFTYSAGPHPQRNNRRALIQTAPSIANYRAGGVAGPPGGNPPGGGGGGGGCGLAIPTAVSGALIATCSPPPATTYSVSWFNACPSATSHHEVWYSQPDGSPYRFGWIEPAQFTLLYVWGAPSRIAIRACDGPSCTALSPSTYVAVPTC